MGGSNDTPSMWTHIISANELFKIILKLKNIKNKNYLCYLDVNSTALSKYKDKDGVHFSQLHLWFLAYFMQLINI